MSKPVEFNKTMFLDTGTVSGALSLYSPIVDGILFKKDRLYLSDSNRVRIALTKREVEALIENLQQALDMGVLDAGS